MLWRVFTIFCWLCAGTMLAIGIYATVYTNGRLHWIAAGRDSLDHMPVQNLEQVPCDAFARAWSILAILRSHRTTREQLSIPDCRPWLTFSDFLIE
jgi:hypothetical protein